MRRRLATLAALLIMVFPAFGAGTASAGFSAVMDFHVADDFIEAAGFPTQTGTITFDDVSGDRVVIDDGVGKFNVSSRKTSGGGNFTHFDSSDNVVASGTWVATGVESFVFFGCEGQECGGTLELNVNLLPTGGGSIPAVLTIICLVGNPPPGTVEGTTLDVSGVGGPNFDDQEFTTAGLTVFISRSRN